MNSEAPYKRIDKGVKRGPRLKPGPKPSSPRRKNGQILETLSNKPEDIRQALQEYSQGATLEQLAERHQVSRQAIYGWLLGDLGGEQHSGLVTQALTARIARADEVLETSDNPLDVTRGREQARFSRMDYERRRPHLYGQKQELTVKAELKMDSILEGHCQKILERIGAVQPKLQVIDVIPEPKDESV